MELSAQRQEQAVSRVANAIEGHVTRLVGVVETLIQRQA